MILENIKDFEWYNEPKNVNFGGHEMTVAAWECTDFWQSKQHGFSKDDGHFFFIPKAGDFTCIIKWHFDTAEHFNQCGMMLRSDAENWFKASIMCESKINQELGSCLTIDGISDWAGVSISEPVTQLWYKIVRRGNDYVAFYSFNGENFIRLRQFYLSPKSEKVAVGAYICSPQNGGFEAVLDEINLID